MNNFLKATLFVLIFSLSLNAHAARFKSGEEQSITRLAETTIPGPGDSHLYLGQLVTHYVFILPFYVKSEGLVLGVSGESGRYMLLPTGKDLTDLQEAGLLPKVLPKDQLSVADYLFGYSLELLILVLVGFNFLKKKIAEKFVK